MSSLLRSFELDLIEGSRLLKTVFGSFTSTRWYSSFAKATGDMLFLSTAFGLGV